ncbi:MAG TPA: 50S ribosomal protein L15 [Methylomirabilota bacterium]|jgi:large subunit ribosomal protein L15
MKLSDLRPAPGAVKSRKRIGRGPGSGHGKTATKGHKGHNARSGGGKAGGFEGGQMPLYRRLPKRGFLPFGGKSEYAVVNLKALGAFAANSVVDPEGLVKAGLIKHSRRHLVKILGGGELGHALTVRVHAVSDSAKNKIESKGGTVEVLPTRASAS